MSHVDRASDLAVQWRKSSRSQQGAQCVEVGATAEFTAVRDSKNPTGPALLLAPSEFTAMIRSAKAGRFDLP
ncbi:hypothetical protein GCM10011581_10830 [Saccharopolyspora subtropica]|uniref:DUF397 domain-containing protein n=1 Tax=Saccharopolyspora thermophila TaxID=89367 RepID=A0A917JLA0_9PSEU|nr:DUF397 domain-containing protein [Saccharopolyspora subtropica]GGI75599.1 hypothetical protein GCM10011581_10830 [Saccharopolyspora subtropica]